MLPATSYIFPSNEWIHKITKGKESDRCDRPGPIQALKAIRLAEGRFTTEKDLPRQDLGHIQYTYEVLSVAAVHVDAHHQCWRLIHWGGTSPVGISRMEIPVYLWREMPPDNLE